MKEIFQVQPLQWGFRGDPYLWKELQEYMVSARMPENEDEFETLFEEAFKHLTGKQLARTRSIFIERYNHGGMSGGRISTEFWIDKGLPLLKERFKSIKK